LDVTTPFQIIYKYNVEKYGIQEQTFNYYIYNNVESVRKSAEFWIIRQSNAWKKIKFNVSYERIDLETFDPIVIDFGLDYIVNVPIVGIIERATLDTLTNVVNLEVWLPVRWGENFKYKFVTPKDVVERYPVVIDPNARTGNPLQGVQGALLDKAAFLGAQPATYIGTNYAPDNFFSSPAGRAEVIADANDASRNFGTVWTMLNPLELQQTRPTRLLEYNNGKRFESKPYTPATADLPGTGFWPAYVGDYQGDGIYLCDVYLKGISQESTLVAVRQWLHFTDDDIIPYGAKTGVTRITRSVQGDTVVEYVMFVPVWLAVDEEE
jgi:hypothetical protein